VFHDDAEQLRPDQRLFDAPIVQPNSGVAPGLDDPCRLCERRANQVLEADHFRMAQDVLQPLGTDTDDESKAIPEERHVGSLGTSGRPQASGIAWGRFLEYTSSLGHRAEGRR